VLGCSEREPEVLQSRSEVDLLRVASEVGLANAEVVVKVIEANTKEAPSEHDCYARVAIESKRGTVEAKIKVWQRKTIRRPSRSRRLRRH